MDKIIISEIIAQGGFNRPIKIFQESFKAVMQLVKSDAMAGGNVLSEAKEK